MSFIYQPINKNAFPFTENAKREFLNLENKLIIASKKFQQAHKAPCLYINTEPNGLDENYVMQVVNELLSDYRMGEESLNVVLHSNGGDIDQAYKLCKMLWKYAKKELNFYVPFAAKSSATLMALGGNTIYMSPIAELGPLDTQLPYRHEVRDYIEYFSFRSVQPTIELLRQEYEQGSTELADALLSRLNSPYSLTEQMEAEKQMTEYAIRLLGTRMLLGIGDKIQREVIASEIAQKLINGYPSHSFCIDIDEAKAIGINVKPLVGNKLVSALEIVRLDMKMNKILVETKKNM